MGYMLIIVIISKLQMKGLSPESPFNFPVVAELLGVEVGIGFGQSVSMAYIGVPKPWLY